MFNNDYLSNKLISEEVEQKNVDFNMITFSLADKVYGINIMNVKEISRVDKFTYIPNTKKFVRGVYNLRGDIISIIDLRILFGLKTLEEIEEENRNKIARDRLEDLIVLNFRDYYVGVIVDGVDKVIGVDSSEIQPPHQLFSDINLKFMKGSIQIDNNIFILLDVLNIFKEQLKDDDRFVSYLDKIIEKNNDLEKQKNSKSISKNIKSTEESYDKNNKKEEVILENKNISFENDFEESSSKKHGAVDNLKSKNDNSLIYTVEDLNKEGFFVSDLNSDWFDLANESNYSDKSKFMDSFFTLEKDTLFKPNFVNKIVSELNFDASKTIYMWNPECGGGYIAYSFAVSLFESNKNKFKIWATDDDFVKISLAPNLTFKKENLDDFYFSHTKKVKDGFSFKKNIIDSIVFEYHNVDHNNFFPEMDVIFIIDKLSFFPSSKQKRLIDGYVDKLSMGGYLIVGKNEVITHNKLKKVDFNDINIYKKI